LAAEGVTSVVQMGRVEKILFAWLVAMLVGVTAAAAYVLIDHATRCSRFEFSAAEWRDPHAHRNKIANRLVQCHRLDGLDAQELKTRLGEPRERYRWKGGVTWSYDAGTRTGFVFESYQTLEVDVLKETQIVKRARIQSAGAD
jgi:hypothetical protein